MPPPDLPQLDEVACSSLFPDVFVISLPASGQRRERALRQLAAAGIAFRFIDAIDGRDRHPLLSRFKPEKFLLRHGRQAVPGEAGCYASHFLAWQICAQLDRPIIVLEDDFQLQDNVTEAFALASELAARYPFIRLEPTRPKPAYTVYATDDFRLVRYLKVPQCLTCYCISPPAASAFVQASEEFVFPVDYFLRHQYLHRIPIYGLSPPPVSPRADSQSDIGNRHLGSAPSWAKLTRHMFKFQALAMNAFVNIAHCVDDLVALLRFF